MIKLILRNKGMIIAILAFIYVFQALIGVISGIIVGMKIIGVL